MLGPQRLKGIGETHMVWQANMVVDKLRHFDEPMRWSAQDLPCPLGTGSLPYHEWIAAPNAVARRCKYAYQIGRVAWKLQAVWPQYEKTRLPRTQSGFACQARRRQMQPVWRVAVGNQSRPLRRRIGFPMVKPGAPDFNLIQWSIVANKIAQRR